MRPMPASDQEASTSRGAACPAAPMALAVILKERGEQPLGDGAGLSAFAALRKSVPQPIFTNFDDKAFLIRAPTQTMRAIDALRYHKPTPEERTDLNLSSWLERVSLHSLNDLLLVCGARKGFRFTSADINGLQRITETLTERYECLNRAFLNMPLEVTRFKFAPHVSRLEDEACFFRTDRVEMEGGADKEFATVQPEEATRWLALHFQWLTRRYILKFAELRNTVAKIRIRYQQYLAAGPVVPSVLATDVPGESGPTEPGVEAEFEAKAQQPFPMFLHQLIQMYHCETREQTTAWTPSCPEPPVDSIGSFAVYLSSTLALQYPLTHDQLSAFQVLLHVLKLSFTVDHEQMRITRIIKVPLPNVHLSVAESAKAHYMTNSALCAIIYAFLANVRELRLVSRQRERLPRRRRSNSSRSNTGVAGVSRRPSNSRLR